MSIDWCHVKVLNFYRCSNVRLRRRRSGEESERTNCDLIRSMNEYECSMALTVIRFETRESVEYRRKDLSVDCITSRGRTL